MRFNQNKVLCGDFETTFTTDEKNERAVFLWCLTDIEGERVGHGYDIVSFFDFLKDYKGYTIFFHNLKYDASYMIDYLMRNGYPYVEKQTQEVNGYTLQKPVSKHSLTAICSTMNVVYQVTVNLAKGKEKNCEVSFHDSSKKLTGSVSSIGKTLGYAKLVDNIDHNKRYEVGVPCEKDVLDYCYRDCKIISLALKKQFEMGLTRMTSSSDALASFKKSLIPSVYGDVDAEYVENVFRSTFPLLQSDVIKGMKKAYQGGLTLVNPIYEYCHETKQNWDCGKGLVFDVNSLYPSRMKDCLLPWGKPEVFNKKYQDNTEYTLFIQKVRATFFLKDDKFPSIAIPSNLPLNASDYIDGDKYIINAYEPIELCLADSDYELLMTSYDVESIEYLGGWMFKAKKGMFDAYIEYWENEKEQATVVGDISRRNNAKLMLNGLYGKFAQKREHTKRIPVWDDEKDTFQWTLIDCDDNRDDIYLPMSIFICAYARKLTVDLANKYYQQVAYIDTDSVHMIGDFKRVYDERGQVIAIDGYDIDIHESRFGAWKHERDMQHSRYIKPKTYLESGEFLRDESGEFLRDLNGDVICADLDVKCAGMGVAPKGQVSFDNFHNGTVYTGNLKTSYIKGGINLKPLDFHISPSYNSRKNGLKISKKQLQYVCKCEIIYT